MANAEGLDHMLNRVMPKDNIGLAALLQTTEAAWENSKFCFIILMLTSVKLGKQVNKYPKELILTLILTLVLNSLKLLRK